MRVSAKFLSGRYPNRYEPLLDVPVTMYRTGHVSCTFGRPATVSSARVYVCRQYPGPTIVIADNVVGVGLHSGFANVTFGSEYTESCAWLRLSPTVDSWREIVCGSPRYAFGRAISTKPSPTSNLYPL